MIIKMAKSAYDTQPAFMPVKTPRAFEVICEQIRAELATGALKAGDKLPSERDLAAQFQVSRNALREALRALEVSGIIRNAKGAHGGAFIQSADPDRIVQAMQDYVHLGDITLNELTEARIALQDIIIRLACERAEERDYVELEAIIERTRAAADVESRYQCAVEFYEALAKITGNRIFGIFVDSLASILHEFITGPGYETLEETLFRSRQRLLRHLKARNADAAAEEMRQHLERVHRHVRKNIKGNLARTV